MLREPQEYEALFQELKADLQNSEEKNVLVFASTAECDSVCAVRILQVRAPAAGALRGRCGCAFQPFIDFKVASVVVLCSWEVRASLSTLKERACRVPDGISQYQRDPKIQEWRNDVMCICAHAQSLEVCARCCGPPLQLLLMNSGVHFSTFPVSGASEVRQICEAQLTGEVPLPSGACVGSHEYWQSVTAVLDRLILPPMFHTELPALEHTPPCTRRHPPPVNIYVRNSSSDQCSLHAAAGAIHHHGELRGRQRHCAAAGSGERL